MKKFNKVAEDIENQISKAIKIAEKPIKGVYEFVSKHKKFIFALAVVYVVFNYLFSDSEDEEVEY